MSAQVLLADVGASNARFALLHGARPGAQVLSLRTDDHPDLQPALHEALDRLGAGPLAGIAVCAAGPPRDGVIELTNCRWRVSEAALTAATGVARPLLVNDFTALAAALPVLSADDLQAVGGGEPVADAPRAVLGPGTGLGVSGLLTGPAGDALITGEGGHVDLPAGSAAETGIIERLRAHLGHVSAEQVLSGGGLVNLHHAMHPGAAARSPQAISRAAAGGDDGARATIRQFCVFLGAVAGDLALTLGARGGVYIGGGIVPAWGTQFDAAAFRERFEDKGRYRDYLRAVPTYIITTAHPALRGLARMYRQARGDEPA